MKALRNLAGLVVVAVLAALLLVGARSPAGRAIVKPAGESGRATYNALAGNVTLKWASAVAGNPLLAAAVGMAIYLALILLVPAVRASTRGLVVGGAAAAALAAALYFSS
jgi:hypothetical protein